MSFMRIFLLFLPILLSAQNIKIAVVAHHGIDQAEKDWMPTITYLNEKIPEHHFQLVPFLPTQFPKLKEEVRAGTIDFIISPPAMYVELELTVGASKMLTLAKENNVTQFGSVIFTHRSSNITSLSQIDNNTRIAAIAPFGFGGWLIGYEILKYHHIPLNEKDVEFLGTQEKIVKAILDNKADIGIVRTGILEKLQSEKEVDLNKITVLHQLIHKNFPFLCSTELYPEWAFARTKHVHNDIAKKVVLTLLSLPKNSDITKNSDSPYHWTAPYNYQKVKELMKRLEIGYYADLKSEVLQKWVKQNEEVIFFILLLFMVVLLLSFIREYRTNKKLRQEKEAKDALLKQVEYHAYHDKLTKLFNRTYLEEVVSTEKSFSIIMLDINNFSYINMSYGFEIGDKLLVKVADILKEAFDAHSAYRLYSDEFALLFNEEIDFKEKIKQIQNYFHNNTIQIETITLHLSFSYGAAYDRDKVIRNTTLALKKSKERGKDRYYIFYEKRDSIDYTKREAFISMHNLLCEALEKDKIVPYFQGIWNNKRNTITKFEVLARIENDDQLISPNQFLEAAQLSGFLPNITKVMIDKSFKMMAENDYSFSINITEDDLSRNYLCVYLNEKSKQYGIKPERVILEILEGMSATGQQDNIRQLEQLKREGYSLAIDDFGAEYSNFERTLELDVDFIKIDAKYIKDIDVNQRSYNVAKSIAFFAKQSNIPCIAEFVHNAAIQKVVEELGIEYSQGYYFSEPSEIPR
ncbi:EAL domain-containing protein [Sulfurovum sp. ST-21]|uniref:EAL domain-containing protein n=1 Tax=Sulfurovum indicum TaxID=2779528 RepID=A0A7M1S1Z0_9BACT|nr:EAL domain-containing protein [Sulfurovum indicum]QOR61244.1 EAL domain-containing protein [Sulfurovum indicum]